MTILHVLAVVFAFQIAFGYLVFRAPRPLTFEIVRVKLAERWLGSLSVLVVCLGLFLTTARLLAP